MASTQAPTGACKAVEIDVADASSVQRAVAQLSSRPDQRIDALVQGDISNCWRWSFVGALAGFIDTELSSQHDSMLMP